MNPLMVLPFRRGWLLAILAAVLAWLLWASGVVKPLERPVADMMSRVLQLRSAPRSPFAAILIDDASVSRFGALPWPRDRIAELVQAANAGGADGVLIDILLADASDEADDAKLEQALHMGDYVLAAVLSPDGGWLLPLPRFGGAAVSAHAHVEVSSDGVMRRISATKQAGDIALPAISIAAAGLAGWQGAVTPGRSLRPDFGQPPDAISQISAHLVIEGDVPGGFFTDRVVFIGLAASGATDQFVLPVGRRGRPVAGVLVHAAAASSIARGSLLHPASGWLVLLAALIAAAIVQWARSRAGRFRVVWIVGVILGVAAAGLVLLWVAGTLLPMVALIASVAMSAAGREALESYEVQRETATVLNSLIDQQPGVAPTALPRGVGGRLRLARRLQRQMARDRDLRRALLDGLREGVVLWDESGSALLANQAITELWGPTPSRAEMMAEIGVADGTPGEGAHGDVQRNGRDLELELREIEAGSVGLIRDVSAERGLERHRREMQRMVSHELKTPLSSISGFGAMIERYDLARDEQLRVAGRIRNEADRLGDMVAAFLDLERLEAGQWRSERSTIDLGALVEERCEFLGPTAEAAGQDLEISVVQGPTIRGSTELLTRLIDNLVGNAIKYSSPGTAIVVTVAPSAAGVELGVRDQGPGIPAEALSHLFERFYRVPGGESPGTGLGLTLVREIADWHGAEVSVESEIGKGSVFRVEFKITNPEEGR